MKSSIHCFQRVRPTFTEYLCKLIELTIFYVPSGTENQCALTNLSAISHIIHLMLTLMERMARHPNHAFKDLKTDLKTLKDIPIDNSFPKILRILFSTPRNANIDIIIKNEVPV